MDARAADGVAEGLGFEPTETDASAVFKTAAFDLVVTAQDVGSYKPDLGNFRRLLAELDGLGVAKDQILHVAQSLRHDIEPANQVGLTTV